MDPVKPKPRLATVWLGGCSVSAIVLLAEKEVV